MDLSQIVTLDVFADRVEVLADGAGRLPDGGSRGASAFAGVAWHHQVLDARVHEQLADLAPRPPQSALDAVHAGQSPATSALATDTAKVNNSVDASMPSACLAGAGRVSGKFAAMK